MDAQNARSHILQEDQLKDFIENIGNEAWVTVYRSERADTGSVSIFSALVPAQKKDKVLQDISWDLLVGEGRPGLIRHYAGDREVKTYFRFGNDDGLEPLLLYRDFHGVRPAYMEVSEEFRLFHDLYHDTERRKYLKIDGNGDEHDIIIFQDSTVRIHLAAIKEFLAAKQAFLAIYIDSTRWSPLALAQLGLQEIQQPWRQNLMFVQLSVRDNQMSFADPRRRCFSRLLGKKLIAGAGSNSRANALNEGEKEFAEFIIGADQDGMPITASCDPDKLSNYFGSNPGAPSYLTPAFFRREVLNKYYSHPKKYSVEDSMVRCGGLWSLQIDNNHARYVVVFLGDLGRLHYQEQLYWKSFNVLSEGGISEVSFRRNMLTQWTDPSRLDLLFKQRLELFQKDWTDKFGWPLFKPLTEADQHYLRTLRIPLTNDHAEFDDQVLSLAKILVDSLNEAKIQTELTTKVPNEKGMAKLERYLGLKSAHGYESHLTFLRNLYKLRHGAGHRKGEEYEKVAATYRLSEREVHEVIEEILTQAIALLDYLAQELLGQGPKPTESLS